MRKIIASLQVSVDGFIEGPNGELDWAMAEDEETWTEVNEMLNSVDTFILGRADSKAFSFPLDSKISIAHDSFQRNSSRDLPPHSKEHALDQQQQQPPNSSSVQPSITTPSKGFTTKFDRIQELTRALYGHEEVQALLRDVSMAFVKSGAKEEFLDSCIEELEYKINVK